MRRLFPALAIIALNVVPVTASDELSLFDELKQFDGEPQAAAAAILDQWAMHQHMGVNLLVERVETAKQQGRLDVALGLIEDLTVLSPHFSEGWMMRGELALEVGDEIAADAAFARAVALEPRRFDALVARGDIAARNGQAQAALDHYTAAVAVYPTMPGLVERIDDVSQQIRAREI